MRRINKIDISSEQHRMKLEKSLQILGEGYVKDSEEIKDNTSD